MTTIPGTHGSHAEGAEPTTVTEAWRRAYSEKLQEAVRVLTEAARLGRPRLVDADTGQPIEQPIESALSAEQADWAEFVTLALAGAAANFGGAEAILAGRSGSWEAEGVRQLLLSTVGADESLLWEHRTEPLQITLYVDELLVERTQAWLEYDEAQSELQRRFEAAEAAEPPIDSSRYVWEYDRDQSGRWAPRDADAPAWSLDAWRASLRQDGVEESQIAELEGSLLESATGVYIPKSREALAELRRLEDERDARLGVDLDERLHEQRLREWTAYGEALKARVEAAAAAIGGLSVPVTVTVDVETYRSPAARSGDLDTGMSLEERLIDAAVMDTPSPEDLPGGPLDRLAGTQER